MTHKARLTRRTPRGPASSTPLDFLAEPPTQWVDTSNPGTVETDGSGNVSQVNDLSGNGHDLTQADPDKRPGLVAGPGTCLVFDGVDDFLQATGLSLLGASYTLVAVIKAAELTDGQFYTALSLSDVSEAAEYVSLGHKGNTPMLAANSEADADVAFTTTTIGTSDRVILMGSVKNTTNRFVRVDADGVGQSTSEQTVSPNDAITIGATGSATTQHFLSGNLCEWMILPGVPTSAERAAIHSYLATKWGVTLDDADDDPADPDPLAFPDISPSARWAADLGITVNGSNEVTLWEDQTGSIDLSQYGTGSPATWVDEEQNGLPVVRFTTKRLAHYDAGTGPTGLFGTAPYPLTVALLIRSAETSPGGQPAAYYGVYNLLHNFRVTVSATFWRAIQEDNAGSSAVFSTVSHATANWFMVVGYANSENDRSIKVDGEAKVTGGVFKGLLVPNVFSLGDAYGRASAINTWAPLDCDIAECAVFERVLSDTDYNSLRSYWETKWGVNLSD